MFINTVNLTNGAKVLLLDQVFEADMLSRLHMLCDEFSTDNPDWQAPDRTDADRFEQLYGVKVCS